MFLTKLKQDNTFVVIHGMFFRIAKLKPDYISCNSGNVSYIFVAACRIAKLKPDYFRCNPGNYVSYCWIAKLKPDYFSCNSGNVSHIFVAG
jgi:hypothetical protein